MNDCASSAKHSTISKFCKKEHSPCRLNITGKSGGWPDKGRLWGPPNLRSNWYRGLLPRRDSDANHSPPSSAEVRNAWSCTNTSTPPIRLHGVVLN